MSSPEEQGMPEKERDLHMNFMGLMREMILEGVVDPRKGTQFTLMQSEPTEPFAELEQIAEKASLVVSVGIPNPLEHEFEDIILSDDELATRDELIRMEGEKLMNDLREDQEE